MIAAAPLEQVLTMTGPLSGGLFSSLPMNEKGIEVTYFVKMLCAKQSPNNALKTCLSSALMAQLYNPSYLGG
jgi:hypothetical protein